MTAPHADAAPPITGIHHAAFRCRDAEETRRFYEGALGLRLAAALPFDKDPGTGAPLRFMHLFFEMGDGRYVAFFDLLDSADPARFKPKSGFNLHVAFEVPSLEDLAAFKARLERAGVPAHGPIDHGFVHSIYTWDPNGIQVEITARTAVHVKIMEEERAAADQAMARWTEETAALRAGGPGAPAKAGT